LQQLHIFNMLLQFWQRAVIIKLNCGHVQVEIGTVQDNFWTVPVKIGTVQDANSTNLGEILGQYKVISSSFTR
jgi:hypothetical protein